MPLPEAWDHLASTSTGRKSSGSSPDGVVRVGNLDHRGALGSQPGGLIGPEQGQAPHVPHIVPAGRNGLAMTPGRTWAHRQGVVGWSTRAANAMGWHVGRVSRCGGAQGLGGDARSWGKLAALEVYWLGLEHRGRQGPTTRAGAGSLD